MKKVMLALVLGSFALSAPTDSRAEVSKLTAKFRKGCTTSNTTGSCTISVAATGSDFGDDTVLLQHAEARGAKFSLVSKRLKGLSDSGSATFRVKNEGGCYRIITGPNGNDAPDVRSNTLCEK